MTARPYLFALGLLFCSSVAFLGCGRKAPPVVPELKTPAAVTQISAIGRGNWVYISWARPMKNLSGKPLQDLMEFEIYRREIRGPGQESPVSLIARVKAHMPENAKVSGNLYEFIDDGEGKGLSYEVRYAYHLKAINYGKEAGPPSKEVLITTIPSPAPPRALKATAGDGMVFLSWEAAKLRMDGKELPRPPCYNIYRGKVYQSFASEPINSEPIEEQSYVDIGLTNEVSYHYVVRTVDNASPPGQESLNSNEVVAIPTDATPPSRPRNLSAAYAGLEVRLAWDTNLEADLAGYFVYRSLYPSGGYVRLNAEPITKITYVDKAFSPSTTYYYAVSAVDSSRRHNESGLSEEVKVDIP